MIASLLANPAISRMGWALLHSLWQGTLVALALKGVLMLVEQRFCRLRYALALACLFVMAALPVFLLCKPQEMSLGDAANYETAQLATSPAAVSSSSVSIPIKRERNLGAGVFHFFTPLVPWISAFWLLGMAMRLLKNIGGIIQVRVLKRKTADHYETKVTASFGGLAIQAGVADISILESRLVSVPTVAGWFKPVVLLPKGALEKIGHPMLDALVAHELAHIRRHDSVVNLFQTIVESFLFFHPAMWWVTETARAEREACCDDEAVAICGNTVVYVRALSQAEQFRSSIPVIALSSSPLLQRIRRLTEMRLSKMNHATALCIALLAVSLIIGMAAGSILLATIPPQNSSVSANKPRATPEAQGTSTISGDIQGKYSLLCGIVVVNPKDFIGKSIPPPPRPKDEKDRVGNCILLDISTPRPFKVPGELQASKLLYKVNPIYPEPVVREHVGIRVLLRINVNEEGLVTSAEVAKSQTVPPDTDSSGKWVGGVPAGVVKSVNSAAIDAVKQWKYSPTLLNGKAIPVLATVSITFGFKKDGSPQIATFIG